MPNITILGVFPLIRYVHSRLVQTTTCQCCGQAVDLIGYWSCGCGFVAPLPRHVFLGCRNCGKYFSWLHCPACNACIHI